MKKTYPFILTLLIHQVCYSQINLDYIKKSNLDPSGLNIVGFFLSDCHFKEKIVSKGNSTFKHIVFYIAPREGYYGALININGKDIEFRTRGKDNFNPHTDVGNADRERGYMLYDKNNNRIYYKDESYLIDKKGYGSSGIYLKIWYKNDILVTRLCELHMGD